MSAVIRSMARFDSQSASGAETGDGLRTITDYFQDVFFVKSYWRPGGDVVGAM